MRPRSASIALAFVAVALLSLPADAEKGGKGKGQGHGNSGAAREKSKGGGGPHNGARDFSGPGNPGRAGGGKGSARFASSDRDLIRSYYRDSYGSSGSCPPGLAKKGNGCMPPGQAKRWSAGSTLPGDVVISPLPSGLRARLAPPLSGYEYGYVGGDVILYAPATRLVVDVYFPF